MMVVRAYQEVTAQSMCPMGAAYTNAGTYQGQSTSTVTPIPPVSVHPHVHFNSSSLLTLEMLKK
jgi:hypothetical protein